MITKKKSVMNQKKKKNEEECFKWKVIAALLHEQIGNKPECILKLLFYDDQYNWNGLEFPLTIQIIDKFERSNPDIAVNLLFNSKKGTYATRRSGFNGKCSKQVNLLMIVDWEKRHYTALKNLSKLFKFFNATYKGAYHFCINYFLHE